MRSAAHGLSARSGRHSHTVSAGGSPSGLGLRRAGRRPGWQVHATLPITTAMPTTNFATPRAFERPPERQLLGGGRYRVSENEPGCWSRPAPDARDSRQWGDSRARADGVAGARERGGRGVRDLAGQLQADAGARGARRAAPHREGAARRRLRGQRAGLPARARSRPASGTRRPNTFSSVSTPWDAFCCRARVPARRPAARRRRDVGVPEPRRRTTTTPASQQGVHLRPGDVAVRRRARHRGRPLVPVGGRARRRTAVHARRLQRERACARGTARSSTGRSWSDAEAAAAQPCRSCRRTRRCT